MKEYQSLSHTRWDCKYHVVFIPKRRKKTIFGALRRHLGEIFRGAGAAQGIEGSRRASDARSRAHVHQHSAEVCGSQRGGVHEGQERDHDRAAVRRAGQRNFTGEVFWARGYFVSTVGLDEEMVRAYIRNQEARGRALRPDEA